jgi:RNA polymerase sigma-70 factor, ECF subfamily
VSGDERLDAIIREHWWAAVASVARRFGDIEIAEDAVQEACAAAVVQWPAAACRLTRAPG